jgi:hypothetical protein
MAIVVWPLQYALWVPLVLAWRLFTAALSLGFVGVLLFFLPVIGWIILIFMLMQRRQTKKLEKMLQRMEGGKPRSIFYPWMLDWVLNSTRSTPAADSSILAPAAGTLGAPEVEMAARSTEPEALEPPVVKDDPAPTVRFNEERTFWFDGTSWRDARVDIPPGVKIDSVNERWWDGTTWRPFPK